MYAFMYYIFKMNETKTKFFHVHPHNGGAEWNHTLGTKNEILVKKKSWKKHHCQNYATVIFFFLSHDARINKLIWQWCHHHCQLYLVIMFMRSLCLKTIFVYVPVATDPSAPPSPLSPTTSNIQQFVFISSSTHSQVPRIFIISTYIPENFPAFTFIWHFFICEKDFLGLWHTHAQCTDKHLYTHSLTIIIKW